MTGLTLEQMCFLSLARTVWRRREAAKMARLAFNEETITETILLDLKATYPGHVHIVAYNKALEAKTGADWIWSFVDASRSMSVTMLVQAKRLENAEHDYHGIGRSIGARNPPVRQIDQLLATAQNQRIPAVYAFYNHVSDVSRVPLSCGSLAKNDTDHILGFGISLALAQKVKDALPSESFDVHKIHSIPLHCLLCTKSAQIGPGGTPGFVASTLAMMSANSGAHVADLEAVGLRPGLHPMVARMLERAPVDADRAGADLIHDFPNIAGVVVLNDRKDA